MATRFLCSKFMFSTRREFYEDLSHLVLNNKVHLERLQPEIEDCTYQESIQKIKAYPYSKLLSIVNKS